MIVWLPKAMLLGMAGTRRMEELSSAPSNESTAVAPGSTHAVAASSIWGLGGFRLITGADTSWHAASLNGWQLVTTDSPDAHTAVQLLHVLFDARPHVFGQQFCHKGLGLVEVLPPEAIPGQSRPPHDFDGDEQVRVCARVCAPPQVVGAQAAHAPHADQPPSTGQHVTVVSVLNPGQVAPPHEGTGALQLRMCVRVEHVADQTLQGLQAPLTARCAVRERELVEGPGHRAP